jgi:NADPH-dependent ferric siderophore reductase
MIVLLIYNHDEKLIEENTQMALVSKKSKPVTRLMSVARTTRLSPNMIRITLTNADLEGFPDDHEGANCKILIPKENQSRESFSDQLINGPRPTVRTYTIRSYRKDAKEVDIDFVVHGDDGPACRWASHANTNSFLGLSGPGAPAKVTSFEADWYILAGDMSALPVLCATLEAMPKDAKGIAIFEILSEEDRIDIIAPEGIEQHWLVHANPHEISTKQIDLLQSIEWPNCRIQTCIAGESNAITGLRQYILKEKDLIKDDVYISGYWKIGLMEDEHQQVKRLEAQS